MYFTNHSNLCIFEKLLNVSVWWQAQIHMRRVEKKVWYSHFSKRFCLLWGESCLWRKIAWWAIVHGLTELDTSMCPTEWPSIAQDPLFPQRPNSAHNQNSTFLLLDKTHSPSIIPEYRDLEPWVWKTNEIPNLDYKHRYVSLHHSSIINF